MSGCRIGKVKMKSGGAPVRLLPSTRTHFHRSVEWMAESIAPTTHAVGFFVLDKDGYVSSGISYDAGFQFSHLKGAIGAMEEQLIKQVWPD